METVAYITVHMRLFRSRGKASEYTCGCGQQAHEWAYDHSVKDPCRLQSPRGQDYSTDLSKYTPMCRRCHRLFDKAHITACPKGHDYTKDNTIIDSGKRKCKTCVYTRNRERRRANPLTPEQHARKMELQRQRRAARSTSGSTC